jgi:hypothetical protein
MSLPSRPTHPHPAGMLLLLKLILWTVCLVASSRQALVLENLELRQQLASVARGRHRPRLFTIDRLFSIAPAVDGDR